ncbi:DUF2264 domain-containing protein [Gryllotalpicola protaetiae]|uniref:DUF2264 domain-containing protein n=1 Tax=Gryllotalpicola protaetiae TaxID=2419771 RepID=A0A387BRJ5_9MICO|nr:DUF2264 domain-containing protein [Gryllotalpicola protaetiae]
MPGLRGLPPLDLELSPHSGFTREHWVAVADRLLLALRPYFSPGRARIELPGQVSSSGRDSDGLEGFARSFLLVGFRLAGEHGADENGFLDWYRAGLITGTDPRSPERWPRLDERDQAKVEAASIALVLELTRPWLWDTLSATEQANIVGWLEGAVGAWYPDNNWVWFQAVVETFLASVGGRFAAADIEHALAFHAACSRAGGWYADSATERAFDYYSGWAMQFYPLFWASQPGTAAFGAAELAPLWRAQLGDYLADYVHLIGGDGMPVLQGRSLIYRFAAAAPLWSGAIAGVDTVSPGLLRRSASGILRAFLDRGVPGDDGLLSLGITRPWPQMAQTYSGAGSPYWAAKGFSGLALPADHPVWTAVEEPLPVERGDVRRVLRAPGWLLSGTAADGVVRLVNHGTDHEVEGTQNADPPLYARLGYSTVTVPPLGMAAVAHPVDQLATVLDASGAPAHRAGFQPLELADDGVAAIGSSRARAHWVEFEPGARDHGSGYAGRVTVGPEVAVSSAVRGAWEVRAVRVLGEPGAARAVRIAGWPIEPGAERGIRSALMPLLGAGDARTEVVAVAGRSPLADLVEVQQLTAPGTESLVVAAVGLGAELGESPQVTETEAGLRITWPDGALSELAVP